MEKFSYTLSTGDFDAKISGTKLELSNLDERLKTLQREKDGLASESMDRIYLRSRKEELGNKESSLSQMYNVALAQLVCRVSWCFSVLWKCHVGAPVASLNQDDWRSYGE